MSGRFCVLSFWSRAESKCVFFSGAFYHLWLLNVTSVYWKKYQKAQDRKFGSNRKPTQLILLNLHSNNWLSAPLLVSLRFHLIPSNFKLTANYRSWVFLYNGAKKTLNFEKWTFAQQPFIFFWEWLEGHMNIGMAAHREWRNILWGKLIASGLKNLKMLTKCTVFGYCEEVKK